MQILKRFWGDEVEEEEDSLSDHADDVAPYPTLYLSVNSDFDNFTKQRKED